ncbi:MAG: lysophospholipid acyltransferase family protein [Gemmatimonadales bacterium]
MKIRIPPALAAAAGGQIARGLAHSWRYSIVDEEHWRSLHQARKPFLFLCWHESLLPLLWRHRGQGITLVVSEARDGQYLADFGESLGYRLVRGSSTRGSVRALIGAIRELKQGRVVAFTPDGPRGPRRQMKPGVVAAAQRSGAAILPLHADADRAWRFRSWDRFMLPQPLARVRVVYGAPVLVEQDDDPDQAQESLERVMADLTRRAEWQDGGATPIA